MTDEHPHKLLRLTREGVLAYGTSWILNVHRNGVIYAVLWSQGHAVGTPNRYAHWRECFELLQPPPHVHIFVIEH